MEALRDGSLKPYDNHHRGQDRPQVLSLALGFIAAVAREVFWAAFLTYLVLMILEKAQPGFVNLFFDPDALLYIIVPVGFIYALAGPLFPPARLEREGSAYWREVLAALVAGASAALLIRSATAGTRLSAMGSVSGGLLAAILALIISLAGGKPGGKRYRT